MSQGESLASLIHQLKREGIASSSVLDAIERVPRDFFVPVEFRSHAFRDIPLPIAEGQTISQPFVVALMTESLALNGTEKVLEIGTGSGYQAAVLAELCRELVSVERIESLALGARAQLAYLGYSNVEVVVSDGSLGYPERSPYDAIIATAACPSPPQPLVDQLREGGRLILPLGSHHSQELVLFNKRNGEIFGRRLGQVRFVPLIGQAAWKEGEAANFHSFD